METKNTLQAGFHCMTIRPPMGIDVPGYFSKRFSDGFINDLHFRALALACGDQKAIIISCEAVGIRADAFNVIKKKIAQRCALDENAIYINCVHSHTSYRITLPGTEGNDPEDDIFKMRLQQQFADCAQFAFEDLKPCTIKIASGEAKGVGFIRRYRMKDGTCKTNPPVGSPDIDHPEGIQDNSLQLIRVIREGGKEILIPAFSTHADVIGGTKYCTDWPGFLVENLQGAFGGEVEAMFLLKCEGDTNHVNVDQPLGTPRKGLDIAKRMARILAGETLKIYDSAVEVPCEKIAFFTEDLKIGKNAYDPVDIPTAQAIRKIYLEKGNMAPELKEFKMGVPEALRIIANLSRPEFFEIRMHAVQIGNIAFVGIPGEPFTSIGREITQRSKMDMTIVTACTNGHQGYFPDYPAFAEDGYESKWTPFSSNCGEILVNGGLAMIERMEKLS